MDKNDTPTRRRRSDRYRDEPQENVKKQYSYDDSHEYSDKTSYHAPNKNPNPYQRYPQSEMPIEHEISHQSIASKKRKRTKRKKTIPILVSVASILAISVVLLVFVFNPNKNNEPDNVVSVISPTENIDTSPTESLILAAEESTPELIEEVTPEPTPLPTVEPTPIPTVEPTKAPVWEIKSFVDEFNRPTGEEYITNSEPIEGIFSNSATSNSKLLVKIIVGKDYLYFNLYEYGRSPAVDVVDDTYFITILPPSDEKIDFSPAEFLYLSAGSSMSTINKFPIILDILGQKGSVSFHFRNSKRSSNTYTFTIDDTSNFSEVYSMLSE